MPGKDGNVVVVVVVVAGSHGELSIETAVLAESGIDCQSPDGRMTSTRYRTTITFGFASTAVTTPDVEKSGSRATGANPGDSGTRRPFTMATVSTTVTVPSATGIDRRFALSVSVISPVEQSYVPLRVAKKPGSSAPSSSSWWSLRRARGDPRQWPGTRACGRRGEFERHEDGQSRQENSNQTCHVQHFSIAAW